MSSVSGSLQLIMAMLLGGVLFSTLSARTGWYDTAGMAAYKKLCKECHGSPYKGAAMHTQSEWKKYFRSDAKRLIAAHADEPKAQPVF